MFRVKSLSLKLVWLGIHFSLNQLTMKNGKHIFGCELVHSDLNVGSIKFFESVFDFQQISDVFLISDIDHSPAKHIPVLQSTSFGDIVKVKDALML